MGYKSRPMQPTASAPSSTMRTVFLLALGLALGLTVIPSFLPTGSSTSVDVGGLLDGGQFFLAAAGVYFGGFLTALTPCVYPLIPITVGVFGARKATSRFKAFLLTSAYVTGMGVVFSVLGVTAALSGKAFGTVLGSPWVVAGLALFLLTLATSMFGAFELALPSGLTTKLNNVGGSGFVGAFLMGSVSGFLAAPCTGPVLTSLLAYVAKTQSIPLGASLMFIYALGIGLPFFVLGVTTVRLPRSGVWMDWVKSFFGVALVALAVNYLKDALPAVRAPLGWLGEELGRTPIVAVAAVLALAGVLVGAIHKSFKAGASQAVPKLVGVLLLALAVQLRIAALDAPQGGTLAVKLGLASEVQRELTWYHFPPKEGLDLAHFDRTLASARSSGKPVMVDFFAEWCAACKELDRHTYVSRTVVEESQRFVTIKVDGTNEEEQIETLYKRYGVRGLPTVLFISSAGEVLENPRVTGFLEADSFLAGLRKVR